MKKSSPSAPHSSHSPAKRTAHSLKTPSAQWPKWLDDAAFYEVYPQTFADSNGDGIGDLPGLIGKLDYIRDLGCTAVWLNPCFVSPFGDAGYDVADFYRIAPRFGTNADFRRLCREAKQRGLRVILDLVAGHTSIDHPWFVSSATDPKSPYRDWYIWTDNWWDHGGLPGHRFTGGHAEQRDAMFMNNFFWFQPALNYGFSAPDPAKPWQQPITAPGPKAVRAELMKIIAFWLELGCDGFRIDMASSIVKNRDGYDIPACQAYWREVRTWMDRTYPEAVLISEWSNPIEAIGGGCHVDFMIHFGTPAYTKLLRAEPQRRKPTTQKPAADEISFFDRSGKGDIRAFLDIWQRQYDATKTAGLISVPTGNHDIPRVSVGRDAADLAVVMTMLMTMPGLPVIYYGDELGMRYVGDTPSCEGAYTRAGSRTPMQWNSRKNAGFSSAPAKALYLPLDPSTDRPTVAQQETDPDSLLNHTRRLLALRHAIPALGNRAGFSALHAQSGHPLFVYLRGDADMDERIVGAVNPSAKPASASITLTSTTLPEVIYGAAKVSARDHQQRLTITLPGRGWALLRA